jgi:pimeloyl-ACP methyl ester carboxylesterase
MPTVTSRDGTAVAYESTGSGPALVLVDGALCSRAFGPSEDLAKVFAPHFTVYRYDRRGRGESGDAPEYSVEREVDDLAAVIEAAGGSAAVLGLSSGGVLCLDAAQRLPSISRVAVYETPFIVDGTREPRPADLVERADAMIAAGQRGKVVASFMALVGTPAFAVVVMRLTPVWKKLKAVAHTIRYDYRVLGDTGAGAPLPADRWDKIAVPVLAVDGGKSPDYLRNAMRAVAAVVPDGTHASLPGQTHMVKPEVLEPVVTGFLVRENPQRTARSE